MDDREICASIDFAWRCDKRIGKCDKRQSNIVSKCDTQTPELDWARCA